MNGLSKKMQKNKMMKNVMNQSYLDFAMFTYGVKLNVKIRK